MIAFIGGTAVFLLFACFTVFFVVAHKKKRYQHLLEKQQLENTYQNQLLQSRLEVQEQSFRHFSEEIHDNVGQLLSIVKMQLYGIRNSSSEEKTMERASECTELLGKAINELRSISHTLNNSYVTSVGLLAAIEKELGRIRSAKEVDCVLHVSGDDYGLGNERELLVFRILQEAVGNAVKHADPKRIIISLQYGPDHLEVDVTDDGAGFDISRKSTGIGLNNMDVRAALLKGTLRVSSIPGAGTSIRLAIPAK